MHIAAAYGVGKFGLSFELFPPKTPAGEEDLFRHLGELMTFHPSFVTCTYGAGGSTRAKTLDIVSQVQTRFRVATASHLTCVGSTVDELRTYLSEAARRGVQNIVALRGDPPRGETQFQPVAGGLSYANELVSLARSEFPALGLAVAGYPETHREAVSPQADLANLKRKVDAGADVVITQLFYDNADYFRFRERAQAAGIAVPIVPGILPATSLAQIERIAALCGAKLPPKLLAALAQRPDDADAQFAAGVEFATRQVGELLAAGVPGLHVYVLNKSPATVAMLRGAGIHG